MVYCTFIILVYLLNLGPSLSIESLYWVVLDYKISGWSRSIWAISLDLVNELEIFVGDLSEFLDSKNEKFVLYSLSIIFCLL